MGRWTDGWISGYICLCSSVRLLQCHSNPVYLHRSIFCFYVPEKWNWSGVWLRAWDIVRDGLPNGLFSRDALFFQPCILFTIHTIKQAQKKQRSFLGHPTPKQRKASAMLGHKWDFYQYQIGYLLFFSFYISLQKQKYLFGEWALSIEMKITRAWKLGHGYRLRGGHLHLLQHSANNLHNLSWRFV